MNAQLKELQNYINTFTEEETTKEQRDDIIDNVVEQFAEHVTIKEVILQMESVLTSESNLIRERSSEFLALFLLHTNHAGAMTKNTFNHMVAFFTTRLNNDAASAPACFLGIRTLFQRHLNFIHVDHLRKLMGAIDMANPPSLPQVARSRSLELFEFIVSSKEIVNLITTEGLEKRFELLYVEAIRSEKDPRCLLKSLKLCKIIMDTFKDTMMDEIIQEFYEVVAVYFPIVFTPPPNDPYKITKEDLKVALESVFMSHNGMAMHVIPLMLEKLTSSVISAKINALETLGRVLKTYKMKSVQNFFKNMLGSIRAEIAAGDDVTVVSQALITIKDISAMIRQRMVATDDEVERTHAVSCWNTIEEVIMNRAFTDVSDMPDSKPGKSGMQMLNALSATNAEVFKMVTDGVVPALLGKFHLSRAVRRKVVIVKHFLGIVLAVPRDYAPMVEHPLNEFRSKFITICENNLSEFLADKPLDVGIEIDPEDERIYEILEELKINSLNILSELLQRFEDMENYHLPLVHVCCKILTTPSQEELLQKAALENLKGMFTACDDIAEVFITGKGCMDALVNSIKTEDVQSDVSLECLCLLSSHRPVFDEVVPVLMEQGIVEKVEVPTLVKFLPDYCDTATLCSSQRAPPLYDAIKRIVTASENDQERMNACVKSPEESKTPILSVLINAIARSEENKDNDARKILPHIVAPASELIAIITRSCDEAHQQLAMEYVLKNFFNEDLTKGKHTCCSGIVGSVFASVRPSVLPVDQIFAISHALVDTIYKAVCCHHRTGSAIAFASILNKLPMGPMLNRIVKEVVEEKILKLIGDEDSYDTVRRGPVKAFALCLKALFQRVHPSGNKLAITYCELIQNAHMDVASELATHISIIMDDLPYCLNKKCFGTIVSHSDRRFFSLCFNKLDAAKAIVADDRKPIMTKALLSLIKCAEDTLLVSNTNKILPLCLETLWEDNEDLLASSLRVTCVFMNKQRMQIVEDLPRIIPRLMELIQTKHENPFVCANAIQCFAVLSTYPYHEISEYIVKIIRALRATLDDERRVVRRLGAKCRNVWSVLYTQTLH